MTTRSGWVIAGTAIACGTCTGAAFGGGFQALSQSASAMGNALAGGAASAEDAGAMWFNPAAMPALGSGTHLMMAGHWIRPSFRYRDGGSTGIFSPPGSGDGGDGGHGVLAPQAFLVGKTGARVWLGLGQNGPFGLETEYEAGWRGRAIAIESKSRALNLNPALAVEVDESFIVGFGLNFQRFDVELLRDTVSAAGRSLIDAHDTTLGWNAGAMIKASEHTRIGLAYRSRMAYTLEGTVNFSGNPVLNRMVTADLTLPESASLSVFSELSSRWDLMADVTWTRWSRLQTVTINPAVPLPAPLATALLPPLSFNWENTVRIGAGVNYKPGTAWKWRAGIAYDPTPSNDRTRTPQLPDQDRIFTAIGAQYNFGTFGRLDVSYMHQFIRNASVNVNVPTPPVASTLRGSFKNRADIISIQHSITF